MNRLRTRLRAGGGGSGTGFVAPADQSVFTNGSANTITTAKPSIEVFADGVSAGTTAATAPYSLAWTPGAKDLDVDMTLTGSTDTRKIAVADATNVPADLTTWAKNNVSVTAGKVDYAGGTSAYRIQSTTASNAQHYINVTPSPVNATGNTCLELIVAPGTLTKLFVQLVSATANHPAVWDFTTMKESASSKTYIYPVEAMGNGFYRFWVGMADGQLATTVRIYLTNTLDLLNAASVTLTTSDYMDVSDVRMIDGPLPFYTRQKSGWNRNGTTADGAERYNLWTEFNSSVSDWGFSPVMFLDVLKPDSYSASNSYKVVYLMPVEATVSAFNNELSIIKQLGLHNSMDCIFVRPTFYGNRTWGGIKSDGTIDHDSYISVMLPAFMDKMYSTQANRNGRALFGYSAGGFAALTQMNRNSSVWGYCVAWDCPVSQAYAAFDQAQHFGTEAQYDAFNPKTNFAAASWNDKCRLIFGGTAIFKTDTADMFTVLQSDLGDPMNNDGSDYATAITNADGKWWKLYKDQSGTGASAHNFLSEWVTPAAAALATLWA